MDITLSWFTHRIQPLKYNKWLICEYSGVDDLLRATKYNLPMDSLNKRICTLVKLTRGQEVPEINKDMYINNKCPPVRFALGHFAFCLYMLLTFLTLHFQLNTLVEEDLRVIFRTPINTEKAEEDPEDEEEEAPKKKAAPRAPKRPRGKSSRADVETSGEASAKKAERERIKMLATAGRGTRPTLPGAT
jgi:hypothetical protein